MVSSPSPGFEFVEINSTGQYYSPDYASAEPIEMTPIVMGTG